MRTSTSQFEVIVDFMETHGDLNKPTDGTGVQSRLTAFHKWSVLARTLNMDTSGDSKTVEKWKKVWSDYKNNTKRKAAKIQKARIKSEQGDSSACSESTSKQLTLSSLEKRVLELIKTPTPTVPIKDDVLVESAVTTSTSEPTSLHVNGINDVVKLQIVKIETAEEEPKKGGMDDDMESVEDNSTPSHHSEGPPSPPLLTRRVFRGHSARQRLQQDNNTTRQPRVHVFSKFDPNHLKLRNRELDIRSRELELRERELQLRELELKQRAQDQAQWQMLFAKGINCLDKFLSKE